MLLLLAFFSYDVIVVAKKVQVEEENETKSNGKSQISLSFLSSTVNDIRRML